MTETQIDPQAPPIFRASIADRGHLLKARLCEITTPAIAGAGAAPDGPVLVLRGHPGMNLPFDIVSWGRIESAQAPGPISNQLRSRDVDYTLTVTISVYRGGGPEAEAVCEDRAHDLLARIEEYVRQYDPTLNGLCFWCFCTGYESDGATDPTITSDGRAIEIVATFAARARISSREVS